MPDSADKGRPSAAPLSVEDADRLADSFTAFWDDGSAPTDAPPLAAPRPVADSNPFGDPDLATVAATPVIEPAPRPFSVTAPMPAVAMVERTPHPGSVTQPMPVVAPVVLQPAPVTRTKPIGKQTLVGIAPINIERPSASEPPPSSSPIQSSPSPAVPGYAIAYTPKDPPSTPAVVIAPEAQSAPDHAPPENRRAFSQTMPSRVRSSPNASVSPPAPSVKPTAIDDDFNPYAAKKGKGKLVGLMLGGTLLLLVSVLVVRGLESSNRALPAQTTVAAPATDVVRAATVGAAIPTPEPAAPAAAPIATTTAREPEAVAVRPVSERAPAKAKTKVKAESLAAPVARAATRAPASEASPPASKPAGKGVIVRDAPF